MELHEFFQWGINFMFMGWIGWQIFKKKKPELLSQSKLPSLNDEKTRNLIANLERMEKEFASRRKEETEKWGGEVGAVKQQMDLTSHQQKKHWEIEMQHLRKEWQKEMGEQRKQWQTEMIETRLQHEQTLQKMKTLCAEAQKILASSKALDLSENPSHEEKEIKEALQAFEDTRIPSVKDLEEARTRLKREAPLDLRSVLNEQLL